MVAVAVRTDASAELALLLLLLLCTAAPPAKPQPEPEPQPEAEPEALIFCRNSATSAAAGCRMHDYDRAHAGNQITSKIWNGHVVPVGEFPWLARLVVDKMVSGTWRRSICSGSILDARSILTAAHCFSRIRLDEMKNVTVNGLRVGILDVSRPTDRDRASRPILKIKIRLGVNSKWTRLETHKFPEIKTLSWLISDGKTTGKPFSHDIAVIDYNGDFPLRQRNLSTICLPRRSSPYNHTLTNRTEASRYQHCHFLGWGLKNADISKPKETFMSAQKLQMRILSGTDCVKSLREALFKGWLFKKHGKIPMEKSDYGPPGEVNDAKKIFKTISEEMARLYLCGLGEFSSGGLCPADSGGPLVCLNDRGQFEVVGVAKGIVKLGMNGKLRNCQTVSEWGFPSLFTPVEFTLPWLASRV